MGYVFFANYINFTIKINVIKHLHNAYVSTKENIQMNILIFAILFAAIYRYYRMRRSIDTVYKALRYKCFVC